MTRELTRKYVDFTQQPDGYFAVGKEKVFDLSNVHTTLTEMPERRAFNSRALRLKAIADVRADAGHLLNTHSQVECFAYRDTRGGTQQVRLFESYRVFKSQDSEVSG